MIKLQVLALVTYFSNAWTSCWFYT